MTAPLFDPDALVRKVRAKAGLSSVATTATLLRNEPKRSNLAAVAASGTLHDESKGSKVADVAPDVMRFEAVNSPSIRVAGTVYKIATSLRADT
jgi:hypothetical protein